LDNKLKDKVAVVTGSSKCIGRALAIGLAREGVKTALVYNTDRMGAETRCHEIREQGDGVKCFTPMFA
jgi:3-oxoacyl-[acyl-carrier protein] reductase